MPKVSDSYDMSREEVSPAESCALPLPPTEESEIGLPTTSAFFFFFFFLLTSFVWTFGFCVSVLFPSRFNLSSTIRILLPPFLIPPRLHVSWEGVYTVRWGPHR